MGALDFLFEGQPPKSVTTYGQTVSGVPTWLSDYTQGLIAQANSIAAQPYQPYTGPRVADTSPTTQAAYDVAVGGVGQGQQVIGRGMNSTEDAITSGGGLSAATPYLQGATGKFTGQTVDDYMNPYVSNVVDAAQAAANKNFNQTLMPGISSKFTRAGQYASSGMLSDANKAANQTTLDVQTQANAALADAYQNANTSFNNDQNRQAQVGATAGQLGSQNQAAQLQGGLNLGTLGSQLQQSNAMDAASLEAVGSEEQTQQQKNLDLAYQDFQNQQAYPSNQINWLSSVIRGLTPTQPTVTNTQNTGPSTSSGPSPLATVASLYAGAQGLSALNGKS